MKETHVSIPLTHFENLIRANERLEVENVKVTQELYDLRDKVRSLEVQLKAPRGDTLIRSLRDAVTKARNSGHIDGFCSLAFQNEVHKVRDLLVDQYGVNNSIPQIRALRDVTGLGLREAKDFVERVTNYLGE